jgi:cytoskeletal protein RodZ
MEQMMKFKSKALVAVFAAAATLGVVGCDNHKSAPAPQQQTTSVTQTAPAQPAATQPVAGPHKDTPAEKQAKIDKLEGTDKARLESMGYKVKAAIGMGTCNADGTDLTNSGWHGNSTSIQYSITLNDGENAKVCVEHHNFVPTVRNPVVLK